MKKIVLALCFLSASMTAIAGVATPKSIKIHSIGSFISYETFLALNGDGQ